MHSKKESIDYKGGKRVKKLLVLINLPFEDYHYLASYHELLLKR